MNIWIFNQYNSEPQYGHLNRHYHFGVQLHKRGHCPVLFFGSTPHNTNQQLISGRKNYRINDGGGFPVVYVKTRRYRSSRIKQVFAMFQYYRNLFSAVRGFDRPDAIIGSSAHPLAAVAAIRMARKYKCPAVTEIRDLWPESIVAYGLASKRNLLVRALYRLEKWIYTKADAVVFTMEGGRDYIVEKGWDTGHGGPVDLNKVHYINNGVDLKRFDADRKQYTLKDEDLDDPDTFKVVYTGSIRRANRIEKITEAAEELQKRGDKRIRFLIWGAGDRVDSLQKAIAEKNLGNIVYKGSVDKRYISSILSRGDLNFFILDDSDLYRFGLSLNKSFEYLASGKPLLIIGKAAHPVTGTYACGAQVYPAAPEQVADALERFAGMDGGKYRALCRNARRAAQDYDYKTLTERLLRVVESGETSDKSMPYDKCAQER